MNKNELIDAIAEKARLSKKDASAAADAVFEAVAEALVKGEEVRISGFGTFAVKERKERKGVNPSNGQEIVIPAVKTAVLKPSKNLKEKLQ